MNPNYQKLAIWAALFVLLLALYNLVSNPGQTRHANEIQYSEFLDAVDKGTVTEAVLAGNRITGTKRDASSNETAFSTYAPEDPNLVTRLRDKGVKFKARPAEDEVQSITSILLSWFPMLLLIGVWIFFMRQMQSGSGRAMGFGKSRAKLLTERHGRVTFEDVAGVDEAKADLEEIVEFLRDPQKFQRLGGRIPRGCLLVGPPGTGKTLIARAVAGEANVPFFTISGSDFVEMFVGVGASRVRDMFEQAKKNAPCIIFIDEIDAVGRHRGAGLGGGNDEREQTLNQLLVEMDGFEANEGIIIIAATNRPDVLDPALLRPGRFDRQIMVPNPDVLGREKILRVHMKKVPLAPDVDPKVIARGTPGFSGADLANLVNEAALLAARRNKRLVTQAEFEDSKDKVMMGAERKTMAMTRGREAGDRLSRGGPCDRQYDRSRQRSAAQGDDHSAWPRPRRDDEPAGARSLELLEAVVRRQDRDGVRRPRCRADHLWPRASEYRCFERHQPGDGHRQAHGHRMGHERQARAAALLRKPAGSVPRPFDHAATEHERGNRQADRRGDAAHRDGRREDRLGSADASQRGA